MKFINYLNENKGLDVSIEDAISLIKKNCQKILSYNLREPLCRGISKFYSNDILFEFEVRKDRFSRGMDQETANNLNDYLETHNHVRRDKSIFVSAFKISLTKFGSIFVIFPIGSNWSYTWSKFEDFNLIPKINLGFNHTDLKNYFRSKGNFDLFDDLSYFTNSIDDNLKIFKLIEKELPKFFFTNKGFKNAIDLKYEIWIDCQKYYATQDKEIINYFYPNYKIKF